VLAIRKARPQVPTSQIASRFQLEIDEDRPEIEIVRATKEIIACKEDPQKHQNKGKTCGAVTKRSDAKAQGFKV
jgi:hypothetical protein